MQHTTPQQRAQITDMLCELRRLSDNVFDTNDLADMACAWLNRRGYIDDPAADAERVLQAVDTICLYKPSRSRAAEAVEDWIHFESPQQREEVCAPPELEPLNVGDRY